jgi:hypothetical protein
VRSKNTPPQLAKTAANSPLLSSCSLRYGYDSADVRAFRGFVFELIDTYTTTFLSGQPATMYALRMLLRPGWPVEVVAEGIKKLQGYMGGLGRRKEDDGVWAEVGLWLGGGELGVAGLLDAYAALLADASFARAKGNKGFSIYAACVGALAADLVAKRGGGAEAAALARVDRCASAKGDVLAVVAGMEGGQEAGAGGVLEVLQRCLQA